MEAISLECEVCLRRAGRTLSRYTIAHKCLRSVDIHVEAILTPINTLTNMLGAYIASLIMHAFTL